MMVWQQTNQTACDRILIQRDVSKQWTHTEIFKHQNQYLGTPFVQYFINQLHLLPIHAQIDFKIATLIYKTLSSGYPAYFHKLISPYQPYHSLRSSSQLLLTVARANLTTGQHVFSYSSPVIWNAVPLSVRDAPIQASPKIIFLSLLCLPTSTT